jgi:outer membrane biosynthesis protein TonB
MTSKSLTSSLLVLALAASTSAFAGTMAKPADTTKPAAAETKTTETKTTTEMKADSKADATPAPKPAKKKVHKKVTKKKVETKTEEKKEEAKPAGTR